MELPDVKPAIVNDNSDGIVSEWVEVTVHDSGGAEVDAIEQDCAELVRAMAAVRTATANILRMRVSSGIGSASSPNQLRRIGCGWPSTSTTLPGRGVEGSGT
jgi:hypothetical protein